MNTSKERLPFKFITFSAILLIAIFAVENINHRFWLNDFKVYYNAALALMNGTQVYGILFALGSGYYKYSPFTLLFVLPFCTLPYSAACVMEYFFLSISIISLFIIAGRIVNKYIVNSGIKNMNLFLAVTFICVVNHLVREVHLGNINVVLLLLLCLSLLFILESKMWLAGMLLAVVVMTKPFFVLLLLPLLLRRNVKVILSFGIFVLLFVLSPAVLTGFSKNLDLHKEWLHTMLDHNAAFPSNNTIESLVKLYIYPVVPPGFQFYVMIAVCIGYLFFFFINKSGEGKNPDKAGLKTANLVVEWFVLIAVVPGLFKTDTQHFLLSLPLLMILFYFVSASGNYLVIACFVAWVLMYGGNSSDLVGKAMSARMDAAGLLGISNLILLCWVLVLHFRSQKQ